MSVNRTTARSAESMPAWAPSERCPDDTTTGAPKPPPGARNATSTAGMLPRYALHAATAVPSGATATSGPVPVSPVGEILAGEDQVPPAVRKAAAIVVPALGGRNTLTAPPAASMPTAGSEIRLTGYGPGGLRATCGAHVPATASAGTADRTGTSEATNRAGRTRRGRLHDRSIEINSRKSARANANHPI